MNEAVDQLIDRMVDDMEQGGSDPVFEAPWQARAFALAVALRQQQQLNWLAFQHQLSTALPSSQAAVDDEATYYSSWLKALEKLLMETDTISETELQNRADEFASGHRDASEFVAGVDHDHAHSHSH